MPFKVVGYTDGGNYILTDSTGNTIADKLPLPKLKVLPAIGEQDDTGHGTEVEKIVSHRQEDGRTLYQVKWRNEPASENSWIEAEAFDGRRMLNKYLKSSSSARQPKDTEQVVKKTAHLLPIEHPTRVQQKRGMLKTTLMTVFALLLIVQATFSSTFQVNFPHCSRSSNGRPLDFINMCQAVMSSAIDRHINDQMRSAFGITFDGNASIGSSHSIRLEVLSHRKQNINGRGFECSKTRHSVRFTSTFFNDHIVSTMPDESVRLEAGECWDMIRTNQCRSDNGLLNLTCTGSSCRATERIVEHFNWWSTQVRIVHSCAYMDRLVTASVANATVFASHCKASDYFCSLDSAIIVWSHDVVLGCPMHIVISNVAFTLRDGLFVSTSSKLAMRFESFEEVCGMKYLIKTHTGAYLTPVTNVLSDLRSHGRLTDQNVLVEMLLADEDYNNAIDTQRVVALRARECLIFRTFLQLFSLIDNQFMITVDLNGISTVLHSFRGNVYIPICKVVTEITVASFSSTCFTDIPVSFIHDGISRNAFLTTRGVIVDDSNIIACDSSEQVFQLNSTFTIIKQANTYRLSRSQLSLLIVPSMAVDLPKDQFSHNLLLENGLDRLDEFALQSEQLRAREVWSSQDGALREQSGIGSIGDGFLQLLHTFTAKIVLVATISILIILFFVFRSCLTRAILGFIRRCFYYPVTTLDITTTPTQPNRANSLII